MVQPLFLTQCFLAVNIGTPNNYHFPFWINGKVVVLGVPILKHFRVDPNQIVPLVF